ncbi:MAG: hypothetical protein ACK46A_10560, partial [Akkermansiaceae bacterium]
GDAGFELGSEMSSLSFHMSDFGVICPSQTSQSFNKTLAPFCGTTSHYDFFSYKGLLADCYLTTYFKS